MHIFIQQCRGMERTYEAPSNEAPHMLLGYQEGRLVTYLQPVHFFDIAPRLAQTWLADFPYHKELGVFCVLGVVSRSCDYINTFQLGYSLDKVYQVGIAKSVHLKFCRTNYARFDATNLEPAPTLKTSPVC